MNTVAAGNVNLEECKDFTAAQDLAGREAANTVGFSIPVVVFHQGGRTNLSGALPLSFVESRLVSRQVKPKATIGAVTDAMNRPEIPEHSQAIANYIVVNRSRYILPPLTLNIQQPVTVYTAGAGSRLRTGFLVLHATTKLAITDGQHRRSGIMRALESLSPQERLDLETDGIGVMITCEADIDQIHQDFADCSKTKPLPPSQLAVYDRRNPANRLVIELEARCPLFNGKIDATSKTLGKNSVSLFLANQLRQFVKTLLTGNWQLADVEFEKQANKFVGQDDDFVRHLNRIVEYIEYLTQVISVWKEIASVPPRDLELSRIPEYRDKPGYVCMSVTGLVVLGRIGHELFRGGNTDWKHYAERFGNVDWSKKGELWQGNLVRDGKIVNNQKLVREATQKVRDAIGWHPSTIDDENEAPETTQAKETQQ